MSQVRIALPWESLEALVEKTASAYDDDTIRVSGRPVRVGLLRDMVALLRQVQGAQVRA